MRFLLLAVTFGCVVIAAPFSHATHARLKLDCTTCHAAALTSTRLGDNLLPKQQACLKCHKTAAIGPPRSTRLARFNHQLHLKLGNVAPMIASAIDHKTYLAPPGKDFRDQLNGSNACIACHRGLDSTDKPGRTALSRMADCLVCHSQIEPPFSCEFCHAKDAKLRPASHSPDFLDTHTSGKMNLDKPTCGVCHGRRFKCLGCH